MALIHELIPKIMADIGAVGKDHTNSFHKYQFRSVDDIMAAVQPALIKHGVTLQTEIKGFQTEALEKGWRSLVYYRVTLMATDDSEHYGEAIGEGVDSGDKGFPKALSGALKYALLHALCIPTEEQKDSEHESPEATHPKKPSERKRNTLDDRADNAERRLKALNEMSVHLHTISNDEKQRAIILADITQGMTASDVKKHVKAEDLEHWAAMLKKRAEQSNPMPEWAK